VNQKYINYTCPLDIPLEDLERCDQITGASTWRLLANQRVFITGGTGFVGKWLLATLLHANENFSLNCKITVLSRNPDTFLEEWPRICGRVRWITGDVKDFQFCDEQFDVIVHAATDVIAQISPEEVFDTCLNGTRRVMELAQKSSRAKVLIVSSGAVYGPLPNGVKQVPETYTREPAPLYEDSAYAEGKRASEIIAIQHATSGLEVKIARIFAVVGPHIPLDKHFAVGNFIQSAIIGADIHLKGDGTAYRSYLYAADMAAWLWTVLIRGQSGRAYNIGSQESLSILELAQEVSKLVGMNAIGVHVIGKQLQGSVPQYYVPDINRSKTELNLAAPMLLSEALQRTVNWYGKYKN
jgi:nucleoside-diphosphate-sugar epimerase